MIQKTVTGTECLPLKNSVLYAAMTIRKSGKMKVIPILAEVENGNASKIPILAMTANAFEEDKKNVHEAGMNGFITKLINIQKLFETLRGSTERRGLI